MLAGPHARIANHRRGSGGAGPSHVTKLSSSRLMRIVVMTNTIG